MPKTVGVIVSPHVRERMLERFPDLVTRDVTACVFSEVNQALEAGRRSKTKPRWAAWANRTSAAVGSRYCWDENEQRCYVIGKMKYADRIRLSDSGKQFDETWVVRTVLPRNTPEEADLEHVHRYRQEQSARLRKRGRGSQNATEIKRPWNHRQKGKT